MERVKGIEPSRLAWKARALPLSYTRMLERKTGFEPATLALARRCSTTEPLSHFVVEGTGFEPVKAVLTDLQSVPFGQLGNPSKFVITIALSCFIKYSY
jgi:hypothetical protein